MTDQHRAQSAEEWEAEHPKEVLVRRMVPTTAILRPLFAAENTGTARWLGVGLRKMREPWHAFAKAPPVMWCV